MKIIADDPEKTTFLDYFEGKQVRVYRMKATGEIAIHKEDMALIMGYNSFHELMSQDSSLDALSEFQRENPGRSAFIEV